MDFDAFGWCGELAERLRELLGEELLFLGLQGSYGRGEANEGSDIDVVAVLRSLTARELELYSRAVASMPFSERACGFICGEEELRGWNESELFLLYNDTLAVYGSLDFIAPLIGDGAAACALRDGACAIYHGCCHNYLYEKSAEALAALYKSAFFVMRVKRFCETGRFARALGELFAGASGLDREILEAFAASRRGERPGGSFCELSSKLVEWSSGLIRASR